MLNQLFWGKNEITINNKQYKIGVSTLKDDQEGKIDIFLYSDDDVIGIDITTNQTKKEPHTDSIYSKSIILYYKNYKEIIYQFNKEYIEYLTSDSTKKPDIYKIQRTLDTNGNIQKQNIYHLKQSLIQLLKAIIENNTPSSPDLDRDNNASKH